MAHNVIHRSGLKSSGVQALMSPKSILRRPAPLPLAPNSPLGIAFSNVASSNKLSPGVHFSASPALATCSLSPSTRRALSAFSLASVGYPIGSGRLLSPVIESGNTPDPSTAMTDALTSPSPRRSPRSPRVFKVHNTSRNHQTNALVIGNTLTPPPSFEDPRSPKPYRPRAVLFEELVLHVPRTHAVEDLGRALSTYPRSPYPSAPIATEDGDDNISDSSTPCGRTSAPLERHATGIRAVAPDILPKRRQATATGSSSPANFESPIMESPGVSSLTAKPAAVDQESESRLNSAFWQAVTLQADPPAGKGFMSPQGIMFGKQDGTPWSPRPHQQEGLVAVASMGGSAHKKAPPRDAIGFRSTNDLSAAFPSFRFALMNVNRVITHPPRARLM